MVTYHFNHTEDGHTFCVNFVSTAPLSWASSHNWEEGRCTGDHLVYNSNAVVTWGGRVWSA